LCFKFVPTERCNNILPIGCIYEELFAKSDIVREINLVETVTSNASTAVSDPSECQTACYALYPDSYYVGVRHGSKTVKCFCAKMGALTAAMMGPNVACDRECGYDGTGFYCGSNSNPSALSLYCIREKNGGSDNLIGGGGGNDNNTLIDDFGSQNLSDIKVMLLKIHDSFLNENISADIMVALLTILAIVLLAVVSYLCVSQGICELSRYA
jgi:hypothetical protein